MRWILLGLGGLLFLCGLGKTAVVWSGEEEIPSQSVPIPAARKSRWVPSKTLFRVHEGFFTPEDNPTLLRPKERLFVSVSGWELFRLEAHPLSAAEKIEIFEVGGYPSPLAPGIPWHGAARIRVPFSRDSQGFFYVRAALGALYEVRNAAPVPLLLRVETHELERDELFWEVAEQKARRAALSGETWLNFLRELEKRHVSRDFIQRQKTRLPWLPSGTLSEAERTLRLASFYLDILRERQAENRTFNDYPLRPLHAPPPIPIKEDLADELSPQNPLTYAVKGPLLLLLETRLLYPSAIQEEVQRYVLTLRHENLPPQRFFYETVPDSLNGLVRDALGRPLGRRRKEALIVPPGNHTFTLESDRPLLVRLVQRRKRSYLLDALRNLENPPTLLKTTLQKAEKNSLKGKYLRAIADALLGDYDEARRIFDEIATSPLDSFFAAGARKERASIEPDPEKALSLLAEAQTWLEPLTTDFAQEMRRHIALEQGRLLRVRGRHSEAFLVFPPDALAQRADALAWTLNPKALEEYEKALEINPYDSDLLTARQRFWFDQTYWKEISPVTSPKGSRPLLDPFSVSVGFNDPSQSVADVRPLPGYAEIPPHQSIAVEVPPDRPTLQVLGVGTFREPTLLRLWIDEEERTLPLLFTRNPFTLSIRPGVHQLRWETPPDKSCRLFVDVRLPPKEPLVTRWDERVYHRLDPGDSLRFPLSLDSRSWIRVLIRSTEGVSSLEVRLDQRLWTPIELENSSPEIPVEFLLPISEGFHVLDVIGHEKNVEVCLQVRVTRRRAQEFPPLPSTLPERNPWEKPDSSRTDEIAVAYREGVELLASGEKNHNENLLLNAVTLFTRILYETDKKDPLHGKTQVARGYALLLLSRPDLAEREARNALNAPSAETRQHAEWLLSMTLADLGDENQALSLLLHLIENGFDGWRLRQELARLYAATGEKETARNLLHALLTLDPQRLEIRNELALETLLEGNLEEGFALMEPLEKVSETSVRRQALYVRVFRELLEGKKETALSLLDTLDAELTGETPEEIALRRFYAWKKERIRQAIRLITEWNTSSHRLPLLSDVAFFNEGWTFSPIFSWRTTIPRHFPEQWRYLGEKNILRYPDRWRTEDAFTGQLTPDLFPITPASSLTLRVVGPTWLRLDVRPALPISDPNRPPTRVRVEIALFERQTLRLREEIEEDTPAPTLRFRDVPHTLPGQVTRLRFRVPPGEHLYEITSFGGVAFVRPYELVPGPDTLFLVERGGQLHLSPSPEGEEHLRLLAETSDFRIKVEETYRLGLDDPSLEPTLRALSEQKDPWALFHQGRKKAEQGNLPEAFRLLTQSGLLQARQEIARLKRLYAQTTQDLREAVAAYDTLPPDENTLEELGKLLLKLGKNARDIGERTFWFNRALQTFEPLAQTHPERRETTLGRLQARQYTHWERLTAVDESATYQDLPGTESEPTFFTARLESALTYPLWETGSFVSLAFSLDATASLTFIRPTRLRLELFGQRPLAPDLSTNNYRIVVERNGVEFLVVNGTYETLVSADLGYFDPGSTYLRFRLEGGDEFDLIILRLYTDRPLTLKDERELPVRDGWYLVSPARSLRYFVGTKTTPLRVRVLGPTMLRLHFAEPTSSLRVLVEKPEGEPLLTEVSSEPPNHETILFLKDTGPQTVTLIPSERVAVRLYVRVAKPARRILTLDPTVIATVTPPRWSRFDPPPRSFIEEPPSPLLPETKWGSFEIDIAQGRNVEGAYSERFYPSYREIGLQHRLRNSSEKLYHRLTLAGREYRGRSPHYEVAEFLFVRLPQKMTLTTHIRGFWQNVRKNIEKAGEFSCTLRRYDTLAPSLTLISLVGYNYAKSSLDKRLRVPTRFASQDIFSTYRRDHERNVVFEATGWYRPFFDVISYARVRAQTNRSLHPTDPDYLSGRLGFRFYVFGFETHLSYEIRRYFADSDRKRARVDRRVGFDLEGGFWLGENRRINATFSYVHSKSADRDYIAVGLSTAFTGSRRLSDYTTAEEGFETEKSYAGW